MRARTTERWGVAVSVVILAVAGVLRLNASGFWLDESYSLAAVDGLGESLRATHGTMGLYYVLLWGWAHLGRSVWSLRALSLLFAFGSVLLLRPIARRVGGARLVAVALPLLTLGSLFQWKATEARAYSLEIFIAVASWRVLLRAIDDERPVRWWLLLALLSICGELSHGLYLMQIVPMAVYALLRSRRPATFLGIGLSFASLLAVSLLLLSASGGNTGTYVPGGIPSWTGSTLDALLSANVVLKIVLAEVLVLGLVWVVRSAWSTRGRRCTDSDPLLPLLWFALPIAALVATSLLANYFNPRYLAPILPALALVLGMTGLHLDDWLARSGRVALRSWRGPGFGSLLVVALVGAGAVTTPTVWSPWREMAAVVSRQARPGDCLVFPALSQDAPSQSRAPFEAAWSMGHRDFAPKVLSPPRPLGKVVRYEAPLSDARIVQLAQGCRRVWFIEDESAGMRLIDRIVGRPRFARAFSQERWSDYHGGLVLAIYRRRSG